MEEEKVNRFFRALSVVMSTIVLLFAVGCLIYLFASGQFSLEYTIKAGMEKGERYSCSRIIEDGRGLGFVQYNCSRPHISIECKGEYYVFAYREDGKWQLNESSKRIMY